MKRGILITSLIFIIINFINAQQKTFFDFKAKTIDGKEVSLAVFKGKKILVVNTASKCRFTPQYKELEALYKKYKDRDFVIVGFPANNFMHQEPGTNVEIKEFCKKTYEVNFPMMAKISVKGRNIDPIYKWLTKKTENGVMNAPVKWNFQKFMIAENGKLIGMLPPKTKPTDERIINWIENK